jgi:hypothetical protein
MTEELLTTALSKELFSRWRVSCLSFPLQLMLSTFIAQKDILPIIHSYDDMKERPGIFDPWFSSHKRLCEMRESQQ